MRRLSREDWLTIAKETLLEARRDDVASLSAAVAFKIFLSLFPSTLAGVAVFGLVTSPAELELLLNRLAQVAPDAAVQLLREPLDQLVTGEQLAGTALVLGVLGGVWAATSAAATLMRALSHAYDVEEQRGFVAQRLLALAITAALFGALVMIFVLLVVGRALQEALLRVLDLGPAENVVGSLLTLGRLLLAIGVLVVLFAFVYWIGPDRHPRPRWEWITPGAVLGVVGWLLLSWLFSVYTAFSGRFAEGGVYATLGGVIVLLLWLQLTMAALLMGGELNAELRRYRRRALA